MQRLARAGLAAGLLLWLALHAVETGRANVNWDEYALLDRAARAWKGGELSGGGRPGLVTLLLCGLLPWFQNEAEALQAARAIWVLPTAFVVLSVLLLARRLAGGELDAGLLAAFALVSLPPFARWSLQVRTDQLALAFGMAGVLLCVPAARLNAARAAAAAGLFMAGWLCSQKVYYCAGLLAVLLAFELRRASWLRLRRVAAWALALAAGAALAYAAFLGLTRAMGWRPAAAVSLQAGLAQFDYYEQRVGWGLYRHQLVTYLVPHAVLLAAALAGTLAAALARRGRASALCLALLAYAALVTYGHKSRFPYFLVTLGVLYALPLGLAWTRLTAGSARGRTGVLGLVLGLGVAVSWPEHAVLLRDTQRVQRQVAAFAEAATRRGLTGFQCEGALFYAPGGFPTYFADGIERLVRARGEAGVEQFLRALEAQRVRYVVLTPCLLEFPAPIVRHFQERYHLLHSRVLVQGTALPPAPVPAEGTFRVAEAGPYRLHARGLLQPLRIEGRALAAGEVVQLEAGEHRYSTSFLPHGAVLAWDVPLPADAAPAAEPFYSFDQLAAFSGEGTARLLLQGERLFH